MLATMESSDIFSDNRLRYPYEHYRAIRAFGPVVRVRGYDFYALTRFDDVQAALRCRVTDRLKPLPVAIA